MGVGDTNTPALAGRAKRRNYLINRKFQLRVATWIALDVFAVCFVGGVLLINVLEPQVRNQIVNPRLAGSPMMTLVGFSFAFAAIAAAGFAGWSVLVTHRVCGPIGVVRRGMEQVARGQMPRFRPLRRKDEFRDFYAAYWRMVHSLRSRRQSRSAALKTILAAAESGAQSSDTSARAAFQQIIDELRPLIREEQRGEPSQSVSQPSGATRAVMASGFSADE